VDVREGCCVTPLLCPCRTLTGRRWRRAAWEPPAGGPRPLTTPSGRWVLLQQQAVDRSSCTSAGQGRPCKWPDSAAVTYCWFLNDAGCRTVLFATGRCCCCHQLQHVLMRGSAASRLCCCDPWSSVFKLNHVVLMCLLSRQTVRGQSWTAVNRAAILRLCVSGEAGRLLSLCCAWCVSRLDWRTPTRLTLWSRP